MTGKNVAKSLTMLTCCRCILCKKLLNL